MIFKPQTDVRYSDKKVVSHDANEIVSNPVEKAHDILDQVEGVDVVAIDEAQFFDADIIEVCNQLANNGLRVIVAGLDMDFKGNPFGPMPHLMAVAEFVTKVHAICTKLETWLTIVTEQQKMTSWFCLVNAMNMSH